MASIVNFGNRNLLNRIFLNRSKFFCSRCLSTGNKNKASDVPTTENKSRFDTIPDFSKPLENKNWVSYGFNKHDEMDDKITMHTSFFFIISVVCVYSGLFLYYMPDYEHRDWARREAFIRLHERERLGLEPIDRNYVDPSKITLPSDEELGDTEIIV